VTRDVRSHVSKAVSDLRFKLEKGNATPLGTITLQLASRSLNVARKFAFGEQFFVISKWHCSRPRRSALGDSWRVTLLRSANWGSQ
jgi:hypothetical protein